MECCGFQWGPGWDIGLGEVGGGPWVAAGLAFHSVSKVNKHIMDHRQLRCSTHRGDSFI